MEQKGDPITRTKKYNEVGYPVDCANMCEMNPRCILWAWDKKVLTCKITLLKGKFKLYLIKKMLINLFCTKW